jgi:phosphatidylglycerol:prolipoprotein diacylglycerol transferase
MIGIINIGLDPVLVRLGPFSIHWYGLMYVVGIVAGLWVTVPYAERFGIDRDAYYAVFWPIVICALIGGRLYFVVQSNLGWYLQHPARILATWEGGMAFYGAVFAGMAAAFVACRRRRVPFARALDVAALFAPLAQAFGRVGNLVNGDIIGYASRLPWATRYTNLQNTFVPSHTTAYAPAAAYELLFSLALFAALYALRFRFRVPGTLFVAWLVTYSVGQFLLFFGRANIVVLFGLKQAQLTAIVVVAIALPAWWWWRGHVLESEPDEAAPLDDQPSRLDATSAP